MLNYTGHPLVDIGLATMTAYAKKELPTELTPADLDDIAAYMTREYTRQPLQSFLTVAFLNSGFTQPAFKKTPERRLDYAKRVLQSYDSEMPTLAEHCVFLGKPAVAIAFGDKEGLPMGRAFRQHIPLLTGEGPINFSPYGEVGLPVSGEAMLAIHALPLGCAKCEGRLLGVHSSDEELMLHFASKFLELNRRVIQLAQQADSTKLPEAPYVHRTLLIETLREAKREAKLEDKEAASVTAYHLSNSGQGVALDMYHLPLEIIGFLQEADNTANHPDWQGIVNRAWEVAPPQKKRQKEAEPFKPRRNWLYEDLFKLPDEASRFIRTYFLRTALRYAKKIATDPRDSYAIKTEMHLVSWKLTAIFLKRIMLMDKEQITKIKELGDTCAKYVQAENDRRFFQDFYTVRYYRDFRRNLIKASNAQIKKGQPPLIDFDTYITVFEEGEDLARVNWDLARDLVLIRMIEQLHKLDWLGQNSDALPSDNEDTDETEA